MRADRICRCGHLHGDHEHYSSSMLWCGQCECPFFWWHWLGRNKVYPTRPFYPELRAVDDGNGAA